MPDPIKLKGSVSSLDEVPESHRDRYTKVGEAYILGEIEIEDTTGLKNSVTATRKERDAHAAALKKFEGVDLEAYNKWQTDKEAADAEAAKSKGDWDSREKQLKDLHAKEIAAKEGENKRLSGALHTEMIQSKARAAISEAGGNELFLLSHVVPSLAIVEEKDGFVVRVMDASGNPRIGDTDGNPMSISQLVAEKKADAKFAGAFQASGAGGTGAPPNGGGGKPGAGDKTIKRADFDKLSPDDQMGHIRAKGVVVD